MKMTKEQREIARALADALWEKSKEHRHESVPEAYGISLAVEHIRGEIVDSHFEEYKTK